MGRVIREINLNYSAFFKFLYDEFDYIKQIIPSSQLSVLEEIIYADKTNKQLLIELCRNKFFKTLVKRYFEFITQLNVYDVLFTRGSLNNLCEEQCHVIFDSNDDKSMRYYKLKYPILYYKYIQSG